MQFTLFDSVKATSFTSEDCDFKSIANMIRYSKEVVKKTDGKMIKLATFGNLATERGSYRTDANVLSITGIELDYDSQEIPVQVAITILKKLGLEAIVHTTFQYTEETPKWRLLMPLSTPVRPEEREGYVNKVNTALGNIFAKESWTLSQAYFFQATTQPLVAYIEGRPLDLVDITPEQIDYNKGLILAVQMASEAAGSTRADKKSSRHMAILKLGTNLAKSGVSKQFLPDVLRSFASMMRKEDTSGKRAPLDYEKEIKTLEDGFNKGLVDREQLGISEAPLQWLQERYFKVLIGSDMRVIKKSVNEDGMYTTAMLKERAFLSYEADKVVIKQTTKGDKRIPATKLWMESPETKKYDSVTFTTRECKPEVFNLFKGFAYTKSDRSLRHCYKDCRLLIEHIRDVICCGNREHFKYLMAWCGDTLTDTDNKKAVAVVLVGDKGTGKSIFGDLMVHLHHGHGVTASQNKHVTGSFNAHLAECTFLLVEEAVWPGDKAGEDTLKQLISGKDMLLEAKGVNAVKVPNLIHTMHLSNHDWSIAASTDERRYFVLKVSDKYRQDMKYFGALVNELSNGGREAFFQILTRVNWKADVRTPPVTEELNRQKTLSMETWQQFLYDALYHGYIKVTENGYDNIYPWSEDSSNLKPISVDTFYKAYCEFSKNAGVVRVKSKIDFGRKVAKIFKAENIGKKEVKDGAVSSKLLFLQNLDCAKDDFKNAMKGGENMFDE